MLTEKQKEIYKSFIGAIIDKNIQLLSSKDRAWGKTYILNELGFRLQAIEYRVFLLTEHMNHQEHFATDILTDVNDFKGTPKRKLVLIVDEYKYCKMIDIREYCDYFKIPIVGFVDYRY